MQTVYLSAKSQEPMPEGVCVVPDHWTHSFTVVTNHDSPVKVDEAVEEIQRHYEVISATEVNLGNGNGIQTFNIHIRTLSRPVPTQRIVDAFLPAFAIVTKNAEICHCR